MDATARFEAWWTNLHPLAYLIETDMLKEYCRAAFSAGLQQGAEEQRKTLKPIVGNLCRWVRFVCRSLPRLSDDATRTTQDGLKYASQLKQAVCTTPRSKPPSPSIRRR